MPLCSFEVMGRLYWFSSSLILFRKKDHIESCIKYTWNEVYTWKEVYYATRMPIGRVIRHGDVEQERLLKRFLGQNLRKILYIDRVIGEGEVKLFQHVVFFF